MFETKLLAYCVINNVRLRQEIILITANPLPVIIHFHEQQRQNVVCHHTRGICRIKYQHSPRVMRPISYILIC